MIGYIESVHNLPESRKLWFPWIGNKKKSADDFRMKLGSTNELQKVFLTSLVRRFSNLFQIIWI
jgi:hypothetical protein